MAAFDEKQQMERAEEEVVSLPYFTEEEVDKLEKMLGYRFKDRMLLARALTHGSYYYPSTPRPLASHDFEVLWYRGDSLLEFLATWMANFKHVPAVIVDTKYLACLAVKIGLHNYLRHNVPWLEDQIDDFKRTIHSNDADIPEVLHAMVKTVMEAIYLDGNKEDLILEVFTELWKKNPLNEICNMSKEYIPTALP